MLLNKAKESPALFAFYASNKKFRFPKHVRILNKLLLDISSRKIKRLIVNMPPRHGKSELISRNFPVWYLGTNPAHRIILTCYNANLAETFGRRVKGIFTENSKDVFNIVIHPQSKSAKRFDILKNDGGIDFVGAGGSITGKGANVFIIDDPIKNDAEANSAHQREKLWDWFTSTAYTRLEPEGIMIVVMTRWHEDDLCGRIFENFDIIPLADYLLYDGNLNDDTWVLAKMPALATANDPLGREEGKALWTKRYPFKKIRSIEKNIGSYKFAGLYQQSPAPASGNIFQRKFFRYFREDEEFFYLKPFEAEKETRKTIAKEFCTTFAVCDLAVTTKQTSDYTVIILFSVTPKKEILIRDVIREKYEGSRHKEIIRDINEKWKPLIIGIESVQYQITLIQELMNEGLAIKELRPDRDKLSRTYPMQARLEAGKIYFPEKEVWLKEFETELMLFPNAKHDDQVDAFAYISFIIANITNQKPVGVKAEKRSRGITSNYNI